MARLRCPGCGFSMEFKVPPREAITCPQCNEYLEDVTPRAAAAPTVMQPARVPTQLEEAEAETAPPRKRAAASPTVVQKARALTKAQPAAQPTVVQPVRETTQLEPVPLQQDEEPQLSGNLDEEEIHEPAGLPDSEDVGLAPEESAEAPAPEEPNLDLAAEAEPEEPAEPSESIVTEEEHKRQAGKKGLVKVQARRVATRMLGRKQQPTMPAVAKKVIVDQEDDDDEEEDDDDNGKPIRLAPAAGDEDDDDDNEAAPRRKLKPAVILTYVGVAAALAFAVPRLLEVAKPYLEDDKKQVAKAVPAPQPAPAPQPPAPQPQPEKPPVTEQPKAEKPPERPVVELPVMPAPRAELKPDEIYKQLLHSSVLIVGANEKEFSIGTGSLVHVDKKLVLTNQHVVMNQRDLAVIFPEYKDGEVIADPLHYEKKEIKGKVVAHDATRDLALIELEKVPDSVKALPLARKSVAPGAKVYSIGSSGAGRRTLWRFSEGSVRQVSYLEAKQRRSGILFKGHVVETQSPVNPGDSGGAVVNGQMELCAVVSMSDRSSDLVSQCVDIREVRAFLDSYGQARGLKWQENAAPVDNSADIERIVLQLLPILEKGTPNEKAKALGVLLDAGPSGRAAIPTLLHIIKGDDEELRRLALLALDRMGTPTEKALPHLREALESEHLLVRRHAALMAARMGKGARTLVPKLLPLLAERDHDTVVAALRAVAAIGPDARAAANRLLILLAREESDLSLNAAEALAAIGKLPAEEAGPAAALLDNPRSLVHITAAGALLTARDDERARALLAAVLRDTNDELVHALAFRFLNELPPDRLLRFGPGYVELVRTGLKHPSRELRLASFALLERTAPEPKEAFEIVLDCFTDMDLEMRLRAIQALNRFGPQSRKAVNLLGSALHEKDEKLCAAAMKALAEMGPDAEPACPALILLMSEEKSHEQAIVTLVAIGKGAVKDLSHALRNRDPHVRVGAANALGRIGADARSTAIALSYLSRNDPYPGVRQAAQKALTLVQAKK